MKDDELGERFLLDDPERLKALAHPMRRRMLTHLNAHGPATSTTLAELLGAKTGTTSYHLRQLEKYGFIEEIQERSSGRERWWRRVVLARDVRLPVPGELPPEGREALEEFHRVHFEEDRALVDRFPAAYEADPAWARGSRALTRMTKEGLERFYEEYIALLLKHGRPEDEAPPDARPLYVRFFTLPADDPTPPKEG